MLKMRALENWRTEAYGCEFETDAVCSVCSAATEVYLEIANLDESPLFRLCGGCLENGDVIIRKAYMENMKKLG